MLPWDQVLHQFGNGGLAGGGIGRESPARAQLNAAIDLEAARAILAGSVVIKAGELGHDCLSVPCLPKSTSLAGWIAHPSPIGPVIDEMKPVVGQDDLHRYAAPKIALSRRANIDVAEILDRLEFHFH